MSKNKFLLHSIIVKTRLDMTNVLSPEFHRKFLLKKLFESVLFKNLRN